MKRYIAVQHCVLTDKTGVYCLKNCHFIGKQGYTGDSMCSMWGKLEREGKKVLRHLGCQAHEFFDEEEELKL